MFGKLSSPLVALGSVALFGGLLVACDKPSAPVAPEHAAHARGGSGITPAALNRQLAELRQATAQFHDIQAARDAGYTILFDPDGEGPGSACLSHPTQGGMGEHYVNPVLLFDGGALDVSRPEALIYEPQKNGKYRLVGVEYVIPFSDLPKTAEPPVLLGQQFMANDNEGFKLWALHAWVWKHNPSEGGMFAPWNPTVTCEFSTK
jgi:hypothetical protein